MFIVLFLFLFIKFLVIGELKEINFLVGLFFMFFIIV